MVNISDSMKSSISLVSKVFKATTQKEAKTIVKSLLRIGAQYNQQAPMANSSGVETVFRHIIIQIVA